MEDKLLMISEIIKSEEDSELKVQMISEVVNIPTSKVEPEVEAEDEEVL